jgi:regulatory protein
VPAHPDPPRTPSTPSAGTAAPGADARPSAGTAAPGADARPSAGAAALGADAPPSAGAAAPGAGAPPSAGTAAPGAGARLSAAVDLAFRFVARRDRTVAEVRRHLERRGLDAGAIDGAVAELAAQGYLDDARYARRFTEDRVTLDGWGSERIERTLRELGVDGEHVSAALRGRDPGTELDAAIALLRRRWREPPATDRDRERALGFLVRKGYDLDLAYDAIREHARL